MGQSQACCSAQCADYDDLIVDPNRKLIKSELRRSKAEQLIEIPGASVVIIDSNGEEVSVASGTFRFIKFAAPSELAVFFVGDSFEDLSATGFYYPLLKETLVCLSNRKAGKQMPGAHVLTMMAGEGDVFGISLPDPLPEGDEQFEAFVKLLTESCMLQVAQEPDVADKIADHIVYGGKRLVGGVEWLTDYTSEHIAKGGVFARSKIGKAEQEVEVGPGAVIAVAGAKFVSSGTVTVATVVMDTLMDTAVMLGEEIRTNTVGNGVEANGAPVTEGRLMRVGRAAGSAGIQVFESLIKNGDRLLDEACDEASAVVGHRYGKGAQGVAREGLGVAQDVKDLRNLVGKKAIMRLTAKGAMYTAKGLLDGKPVKQNNSEDVKRLLAGASVANGLGGVASNSSKV